MKWLVMAPSPVNGTGFDPHGGLDPDSSGKTARPGYPHLMKGPPMPNKHKISRDEAVPFEIDHEALIPELLDANIDKLLQQVKDLIHVVADLQKRVERLEAKELHAQEEPLA